MMAELERHAAEDQRQQNQRDRHVERGHQRGVGFREGREEPTAAENQPCLVAVPHGRDGGLHVIALARILCEGKEDADAEIEAVERDIEEDGKGDENRPDHGEFDAKHGSALLC
jgi:hypothetical protein